MYSQRDGRSFTPLSEPILATFSNRNFTDLIPQPRGPLVWRPSPDEALQEILYYDRESPNRKYGMGLLHAPVMPTFNEVLAQTMDPLGAELESDELDELPDEDPNASTPEESNFDASDDFEVTSPDIRHPSTIGISFCAKLDTDGSVVVRLPLSRRFFWQPENTEEFQLNGRYESCTRRWTDNEGVSRSLPIWRRIPAILPDTAVIIENSELSHEKVIRKDVEMPSGSPLSLRLEVFPRSLQGQENIWLLTVVIRNSTDPTQLQNSYESILYQTFFDVKISGGSFEKYPENGRPFNELDLEEQSLALLYRESATWGIGHGCAAGWNANPNQSPDTLFADVLPAVELPSMTPDITLNGEQVRLSMRDLANLPENGVGDAWQSLDNLAAGYSAWIQQERVVVANLSSNHAKVANRHLDFCEVSLSRINGGISLLKNDVRSRSAFKLANLSMLLQQIATKQLTRRPLQWDTGLGILTPQDENQSPWNIYRNNLEDSNLGYWRAFQIAFLLMSLVGAQDGETPDREIVDLVWFPTGGGKTEAYLVVLAFYIFHQRLITTEDGAGPRRDGTNVLMRYTLRMLTTQQFQRAASLICAMEFLRRNPSLHGLGNIPGQRFSLGLWIGSDGAPNTCAAAKKEISKFKRRDITGNPLVITECPWCRSEIGRFSGPLPRGVRASRRIAGITDHDGEGPLLHCTDRDCSYGSSDNHQDWLPVEVIDERIYNSPPSLVIATADKLAMIAYRPEAGALFGRCFLSNGNVHQKSIPPGLIIQDELHLISGPLGTMYALYEGIIERLCSYEGDGKLIKPKLITSTATIRGVQDQVLSLYARTETQLFPSPGLLMGDSFFGRYEQDVNGRLSDGRLYLGIHANNYGSHLTTQVRTFSSALFCPFSFDVDLRDPWWTLLAFYNSIRELGGAKNFV